MRFPTVLFDLDGTLIDSGGIILASFRHATRTVLNRVISDEELAARVGGSSIQEQMRAIDEDRAEELVEAYREHNMPLHADIEAFDGIADVLSELSAEDRKLGIVTAKRKSAVTLALQLLKLEGYFSTVVTAESTRNHKPHPEPILHALEDLDADPASAAFVGDSPFDMGAGRAANVFTIGVAWGGIHPPERLKDAGANVLVSSPEELLRVL